MNLDNTKNDNDELMIDDVFYCIHDDLDYCRCRKPKPGLILKAAEKWNIDLVMVATFSEFLSDKMLKLPKYGCINITA